MSLGRASVVTLTVALCVALLASLIPAASLAAEGGKKREYIVTLDVKDSGRSFRPTSRENKVRFRQRAKAARVKTAEVAERNGVRPRHRYGNVITGFSARMTRAEARKLARDPSVAGIRVARTFRLAATGPACNMAGSNTPCVPDGIKRVKALPGSPANVNANVAIIDSGIGPAKDGVPDPAIAGELNVAGGYNCSGTVPTQQAGESARAFAERLADYRGRYYDTQGHGTHVAGTIGARDNGIGAVGVAPGANLWAVRVFGNSGFTSETNIVCGLDWVLGTWSNDLPDIDVVNMSIQGPRLDDIENCSVIKDLALQAETDPTVEYDPMHLAICRLKDIKVPVVASAGNSAMNANNSAPGGYDSVISVAAMTDTDGVGWEDGDRAGCFGYSAERDDTFASYSNYGADIDIVAPGTCVMSTYHEDPSGDTLVPSSGTSMAAPHVTGAIARYIHEKGRPDSVGEMRQLIRAAGRMDWNIKSDPVYLGVNDVPNRVLDVAALTGGNAVKTFLTHEKLSAAGNTASVATRVDVQRSGGYTGQVNLSVSGLPGGAGSASFDDATLNGLGKNALGTKLTFDLGTSGSEGIYDVKVTSQGNNAGSHDRPLQLTVDRTAPAVSGLSPKVRGQKTGISRKGATQVYLQWSVNDNVSGVRSAKLQRKTGNAAWKYAGVGGASSARVYLKPGQDNRFRVKAADRLGNTRNSYSVSARLSIRDDKWGGWNKTGAWKTKRVKKAYRGSLLIAKAGQARLKTKFTGKAVAIAAPVGNGRGKFRVRVDGGAWQTVNTKTRKAGQRKVVWTAKLGSGSHTVEIQRVSGQPAIDGLLIVR